MSPTLHDILNGARLVRVRDGELVGEQIAVWHGGHTVNYYSVRPTADGLEIDATHSTSVGDFETGEVTHWEVEQNIEAVWSEAVER